MRFRRASLADRNAIVFVVARALSLLVPLLSFPVLGRALGPQGVGLIAYAQAFIQYAAVVVDFGFQYVTIATVAQCRDDATAVRRLFWSVSLFRAMLFVPCVLLSVPIALWLGESFEEREVILMSLMLLTGVLLTPVWLYQGLERGVTFAVLALTPRLLVIPALWFLIDRPEHVERAAMILFGAELASGLLLFLIRLEAVGSRPRAGRLGHCEAGSCAGLRCLDRLGDLDQCGLRDAACAARVRGARPWSVCTRRLIAWYAPCTRSCIRWCRPINRRPPDCGRPTRRRRGA